MATTEVVRQVEALGLTDNVIFAGYASDREMAALYSSPARS